MNITRKLLKQYSIASKEQTLTLYSIKIMYCKPSPECHKTSKEQRGNDATSLYTCTKATRSRQRATLTERLGAQLRGGNSCACERKSDVTTT